MKRRLSGPVPYLGRLAILAQIIGALCFVWFLLSSEGVRLPFTGSGDWTLRAQFSDVGGIHDGERTPVLVAGVPAGAVTDVRVAHGLAVVTIRLNASARGVVKDDATASIEPRSALEDMTVDISPGSAVAPPARPGALIAASHTQPTTTLDRVTSVLDSDTHTQLEILLDQLARGVGGRGGELQSAVTRLDALLDPATRLAGALARRRALLARLVGTVSRLSAAAQRHDVALSRTLRAGAATLAATAHQESGITSAVRRLPSTMGALDHALAGIRSLAGPLIPTLAGLHGTADALPGALRSTRAVVPQASSLLGAVQAFASDSGPGLAAAAGVLRGLAPTAAALTPGISRVRPIVAAVNARRQGIAQLGERFSGVLSTNDSNGPILRGLGSFEPFNPADFGFPSAQGAQRTALATRAAEALRLACLRGGLVACLVRYMVPGLPGSVR
ncbi:MAG: MlaD family protein [Solirubrobacteraceae bacterium]